MYRLSSAKSSPGQRMAAMDGVVAMVDAGREQNSCAAVVGRVVGVRVKSKRNVIVVDVGDDGLVDFAFSGSAPVSEGDLVAIAALDADDRPGHGECRSVGRRRIPQPVDAPCVELGSVHLVQLVLCSSARLGLSSNAPHDVAVIGSQVARVGQAWRADKTQTDDVKARQTMLVISAIPDEPTVPSALVRASPAWNNSIIQECPLVPINDAENGRS